MRRFIIRPLAALLLFSVILSPFTKAQEEFIPKIIDEASTLALARDTYMSLMRKTPDAFSGVMNWVNLTLYGSHAYDAYMGGTKDHYWALASETVNQGLHTFVLAPISGSTGVTVGVVGSSLTTPVGGALIGASTTAMVYNFGSGLIDRLFPNYRDYLQMAAVNEGGKPYTDNFSDFLEQQRLQDIQNMLTWDFTPSAPIPPRDSKALDEVERMLDPDGLPPSDAKTLDDIEKMLEEPTGLESALHAHFFLRYYEITDLDAGGPGQIENVEELKKKAEKFELLGECRQIIFDGAASLAKITPKKGATMEQLQAYIAAAESIPKKAVKDAVQALRSGR